MGLKRDEVAALLHEAHEACFKAPGRDVLGMSHGPFAGVNKTLSIVAELEAEIQTLKAELADRN